LRTIKALTKSEDDCPTQGNAADDLGQLSSATESPNDNTATDFPGKLMLKLRVDTLNICSDCRILRLFAVV